MATPGEPSDRAKRDLRAVLALHRELNPTPGLPTLVAIEPTSGQLFFCAAKGLSWKRDEAARRSDLRST